MSPGPIAPVKAELERALELMHARWTPEQVDFVAVIMSDQTVLLARKALGEDVDAELGQVLTQLAGLEWVEAREASKLAGRVLEGVFGAMIKTAIAAAL
jgi:hypothetical protein